VEPLKERLVDEPRGRDRLAFRERAPRPPSLEHTLSTGFARKTLTIPGADRPDRRVPGPSAPPQRAGIKRLFLAALGCSCEQQPEAFEAVADLRPASFARALWKCGPGPFARWDSTTAPSPSFLN
jgi:hypothetical protein